MTQKLDMRQINNLMTGNSLATEIPSSSEDARAFVVIRAYKPDGTRVSKFLNSKDKSETRFWLRKYEIGKEYIENEWYVCDDELINSIYIEDIKSISQLEFELSKYLEDYSCLDVEWRCDNPL